MTDLEYPTPSERTRAASWDPVPVALALASVIGLAMLFFFGAAGYDDGVWGDVFWQMFSLGGVLAFLTGAAAYVVGRGRRENQTKRMGTVGVAWFAIAVLIVVIWEAVS
jgi:peptidoglycan/LPS O-acetylase OafA/YrhL